MLRAITRNDIPPPHKPHPNTLKGYSHEHNLGKVDFPDSRKKSTNTHFYTKKPQVASRADFEHPSTSHFDLTHNHLKNKLPVSMTKNDFRPFKYNSGDFYDGGKMKNFGNGGDVRIREMKDSKSLSLNYDPSGVLDAYRSKPSRSRLELLKSNIRFSKNEGENLKNEKNKNFAKNENIGKNGEKSKIENFSKNSKNESFMKKSHYTEFCESLNTKTRFPKIRSISKQRNFDIISNIEKKGNNRGNFGFDLYQNDVKKNLRSGLSDGIPPVKQRFFTY